MSIKVNTEHYQCMKVIDSLEEGCDLDINFINQFISPVEVIYFIPLDFLREQIDRCKDPNVEYTDSVQFSSDTIGELEILMFNAKVANRKGIYLKASNL